MTSQLEQKAAALTMSSMGYNGSKAITGTSAVTPDAGYQWVCIKFIADSVVAAQTNGSHKGTGDAVTVPNADLSVFTLFNAGDSVLGLWSSITLASGEAMGYNG